MSVRRLLLWRHGRTTWNAEKRFQGQADPPLDDLGRDQALASAPLLVNESPQLILASDLVRTADTARVLADLLDGVELRLDKRLRESDMGRWQGKTREEIEREFPEEFQAWHAGQVVRRGGGELAGEVADRAGACLSEIDEETVVVVSHGGTIKAITGRLLGLDEQMWRVIAPLANCHWTELRLENAGWRLHRHNVGARGVPLSPALSRVDSELAVDADEAAGDEPAAESVEPVGAARPGGPVESDEPREGQVGSVDGVVLPSGADSDRARRAERAGRDVAGTYRLAQLKGELPESRP